MIDHWVLNSLRVMLLGLLWMSFGASVFAAEFKIDSPSDSTISLNSDVQVNVLIHTQGESINALEGMVVFPSDLLEVKEIRDQESVVVLWLEQPHVSEKGAIEFSGVIPGGYDGEDWAVFSIVFHAVKEGTGTIESKNTQLLLNDGKGTPADLSLANYSFVIQENAVNTESITSLEDHDAPEPFDPILIADPLLLEGETVLIFETQDKGSGIDHYEVKEGEGKFKIVKSPYALENQDLDEPIIVRAVDKAGNSREAYFAPSIDDQGEQDLKKSVRWFWLFVVIAVVCGGTLVGFRFRKKKRMRKGRRG